MTGHHLEDQPEITVSNGLLRILWNRAIIGDCLACDELFTTAGAAADHSRTWGHAVQCWSTVDWTYHPDHHPAALS